MPDHPLSNRKNSARANAFRTALVAACVLGLAASITLHLQVITASAASPQVVGDEACEKYAVDIESFATCEDGKVVRPEPEATPSPAPAPTKAALPAPARSAPSMAANAAGKTLVTETSRSATAGKQAAALASARNADQPSAGP